MILGSVMRAAGDALGAVEGVALRSLSYAAFQSERIGEGLAKHAIDTAIGHLAKSGALDNVALGVRNLVDRVEAINVTFTPTVKAAADDAARGAAALS